MVKIAVLAEITHSKRRFHDQMSIIVQSSCRPVTGRKKMPKATIIRCQIILRLSVRRIDTQTDQVSIARMQIQFSLRE